MAYRKIKLKDLVINSANDRHGQLASEDAAISELFRTNDQHMRGLAKDLVSTNEVFEPPLVFERDGIFVVADGNRRTTCLKLIDDPKRAPSQEL
ncbi:MAG: hypothetical protein KGO94_09660 [Alphaproteobacteria bacterium]|nr:hypothetical protein [Alphaproteobacteria bacterium]